MKAWVLFEPRQSAFSNSPAVRKVTEFAEEDRLKESNSSNHHIRCVQRAGDVIIIPNGWAHLTYNLASSVGLAKEFMSVPTGNTRSESNIRTLQRAKLKAAKTNGNDQDIATTENRSGRIDAGAFIRSVEDEGMTAEAAAKEFLNSYSNEAVMDLLTLAVRNTAPKATSLAASYSCSSLSDLELESLLKMHRDSCWFSPQLQEIIENAMLNGGAIEGPPSDFSLKCSPRCMYRLQSLVSSSMEKNVALEASTMIEVNEVFTGLCGQVFDALINSCGHRRNATFLSASQAAHDFARAGAFDTVSKLLRNGYNILEPVKANSMYDGLTSSTFSNPLASTFIRAGYLEHAARMIKEYPKSGAQTDSFGTSALELLHSHTVSPPKLPVVDGPDAPYGFGGWQPKHERRASGQKPFKDEHKLCDGIAEVSGQAVTENPEIFIKDYIIKDLPVMVRDFVRYDTGLSPLIDKFKRRSISRIPGTIDAEITPSTKTRSAPQSNLKKRSSIENFVESITKKYAGSDTKETPSYLSENHLQVGTQSVSLAELYPDLPSFMDEGIGGHARFNMTREQVYLGGTASRVRQRIHNSALDALIYGRRSWVLTRPHQSTISHQPVFDDIGVSAKGDISITANQHIQCVQRSGDMLFIPRSWGHMFYNLEVSIGKYVEFKMYNLLDQSSAKKSDGAFDEKNNNENGNSKINVAAFVTAIENENNLEHALTKYLKGRSRKVKCQRSIMNFPLSPGILICLHSLPFSLLLDSFA